MNTIASNSFDPFDPFDPSLSSSNPEFSSLTTAQTNLAASRPVQANGQSLNRIPNPGTASFLPLNGTSGQGMDKVETGGGENRGWDACGVCSQGHVENGAGLYEHAGKTATLGGTVGVANLQYQHYYIVSTLRTEREGDHFGVLHHGHVQCQDDINDPIGPHPIANMLSFLDYELRPSIEASGSFKIREQLVQMNVPDQVGSFPCDDCPNLSPFVRRCELK